MLYFFECYINDIMSHLIFMFIKMLFYMLIKILLYIIIKLLKEKRSEKYYEINEFCSY